jgi:pyrimidine deaminase RibD-like protein
MAYDADRLMALALDEARAALEHGDVPIGAVVARTGTGEVISRRHNERELVGDPTAHAEILALRHLRHPVDRLSPAHPDRRHVHARRQQVAGRRGSGHLSGGARSVGPVT